MLRWHNCRVFTDFAAAVLRRNMLQQCLKWTSNPPRRPTTDTTQHHAVGPDGLILWHKGQQLGMQSWHSMQQRAAAVIACIDSAGMDHYASHRFRSQTELSSFSRFSHCFMQRRWHQLMRMHRRCHRLVCVHQRCPHSV